MIRREFLRHMTATAAGLLVPGPKVFDMGRGRKLLGPVKVRGWSIGPMMYGSGSPTLPGSTIVWGIAEYLFEMPDGSAVRVREDSCPVDLVSGLRVIRVGDLSVVRVDGRLMWERT